MAFLTRGWRGAAAILVIAACGCSLAPKTIEDDEFLRLQGDSARKGLDVTRLVALARGSTATGDYKLGPGDLLDVEVYGLYGIPAQGAGAYYGIQPTRLRVRVSQEGMMVLPFIPPVRVLDMTADQAEESIRQEYAKGILKEPRVSVLLQQPATIKVAVLGAVKAPDIYDLDRRQQTLAHAVMKAGGPKLGTTVDGEVATGKVVVTRGSEPGSARTAGSGASGDAAAGEGVGIEEYTLPVYGAPRPFKDIPLFDGDSVHVDGKPQPQFLVTGIVDRPGYFPLPFGRELDLYEALGHAGGIDPGWAPPYVRIQRRAADGRYVCAEFDVREPEKCAKVRIRDGDVLWVRHTFWTRLRVFFDSVFNIGGGAYYQLNPNR
ncbi:MAG: polysaccharide export protein [Planctomycetes bacterium]|nr:polysaccharide export protein [Planctomycetota bacterium]